jgi:hypothetical protein
LYTLPYRRFQYGRRADDNATLVFKTPEEMIAAFKQVYGYVTQETIDRAYRRFSAG